jgi:hypothetical protein
MTSWRNRAVQLQEATHRTVPKPTKDSSVTSVTQQNAGVTDSPAATERLGAIAETFGIDWAAAQTQLLPGDAEAAVQQLDADAGDGAEVACVRLWLELLAADGSKT